MMVENAMDFAERRRELMLELIDLCDRIHAHVVGSQAA